MAKIMKLTALISSVLAVVLYILKIDWAYITALTVAYHFIMRLTVGFAFDKLMNNKADYTKKHYRLLPFEKKLYEKLKVKKWKAKMPTYAPDTFSMKEHTCSEIAQACCQAELVHETIALLSFVPLLFAIPFGEFFVFLITSLVAAAFDSIFIIMQRYNRPRIIRLIK